MRIIIWIGDRKVNHPHSAINHKPQEFFWLCKIWLCIIILINTPAIRIRYRIIKTKPCGNWFIISELSVDFVNNFK